jgi:hypothetical protein
MLGVCEDFRRTDFRISETSRFKSSGDAEIVSDSEEPISGNVFERMGVGSFAQMILDRSNVPFKCESSIGGNPPSPPLV